MALPRNNITPIPNNEPDAVPSLWNTRYQEIDENFGNLDGRLVARENEIAQARGGKPTLDERLDDMDIAFLERVFADTEEVKPYLARHPEYQDLAARMARLYEEITTRALENEKSS